MSGKKKQTLFASKEYAPTARIASFLRELADRLEAGTVVLRQGEEEVAVEVPQALELEVSLDAKEKGPKGTKRSLELELEWHEGGGGGGPITVE